MHLIQVSGDILNSTLMNHPDLGWDPQHWEDSVNNMMESGYVYGREAIIDSVRHLLITMSIIILL